MTRRELDIMILKAQQTRDETMDIFARRFERAEMNPEYADIEMNEEFEDGLDRETA